jgi:hypothetical protein
MKHRDGRKVVRLKKGIHIREDPMRGDFFGSFRGFSFLERRHRSTRRGRVDPGDRPSARFIADGMTGYARAQMRVPIARQPDRADSGDVSGHRVGAPRRAVSRVTRHARRRARRRSALRRPDRVHARARRGGRHAAGVQVRVERGVLSARARGKSSASPPPRAVSRIVPTRDAADRSRPRASVPSPSPVPGS